MRPRTVTSSPVFVSTYDTPVALPSSLLSTSRAIAPAMMVSFLVASAGGISTVDDWKFEWVEQPRPHCAQ